MIYLKYLKVVLVSIPFNDFSQLFNLNGIKRSVVSIYKSILKFTEIPVVADLFRIFYLINLTDGDKCVKHTN